MSINIIKYEPSYHNKYNMEKIFKYELKLCIKNRQKIPKKLLILTGAVISRSNPIIGCASTALHGLSGFQGADLHGRWQDDFMQSLGFMSQ